MSPGWVAVMVQVPVLMAVTVEPLVPETVHTSVEPEVKVTGRPEDAVAVSVCDWP